MAMNSLFLISVVFTSVSGQFIETDHRLHSVPLPIRRRINNAQYEIQPSVGREIEFRPETAKTSNQERRHIEHNHGGNIEPHFNIKCNENFHQTGDRNPETIPLQRQTNFNERHQEYSENRNLGPQEPILGTEIQHGNRNVENQNHRNNGDFNLKTNLDNLQNTHQGHLHNQLKHQTSHNLRTNEQTNQQNHRLYEDSRESGPQTNINTRHFDGPAQNQDNQSNFPFNDQQAQNSKTNINDENANNNRHAEATLRAIDSNSYGQQHIDSISNHRNHNTKPSKQNTEPTKVYYNRNHDGSHSTEPTRITDERSVTAGIKSTEENELASKSPEGRMGNNADDKWIWSDDGKTTVPTPTVDDRAAFTGDKCPDGKVRINGVCAETD